MSTTNVAGLRLLPGRDQGPDPVGLNRFRTGFGLLSYAVLSAVAGMAAEHYRPGGTLWQQNAALSLTRVIGQMQSRVCCHD